jgi:phosphate transport system protein
VRTHLHREIENLKKKILALGAVVEELVIIAVRAIAQRDSALAARGIEADEEIDQMEVDLEEECLKILALHQPVAIDLRFVIAVLKINSDLERIGDLAVNVAERAAFLVTQPVVDIPFDFPGMADKVQAMVRDSLDALVNMDGALAHAVTMADDEVDTINRQMFHQIRDGFRDHPDQIGQLMHYMLVSRHLERIADHATNVAEDVIYMIEGQIVRHRTEDYRAKAMEPIRGYTE